MQRNYVGKHLAYSAKALRNIDVTYTRIRRQALGIPKYQIAHDGTIKSTSLDEIYFGRPRPSQVILLHVARLVGHALRANTPLRDLWRSHFWRDKLPHQSHFRVVADLLHVDFHALEQAASDRVAWKAMLRTVEESFSSRPHPVYTTDPHWHRSVQSANSTEQLQFVEEGQFPHILFPGYLHAYIDGSFYKVDEQHCSGFGV